MAKITRIDAPDALSIVMTLDDGRQLRASSAFTTFASWCMAGNLEVEFTGSIDEIRHIGIVPGTPGSALRGEDGLAALAIWLDEEYRRVAARPYAGAGVEHQRAGQLATLAEIAAIIRTGCLPAHSPVASHALARQELLARQDAELLRGDQHAPVPDPDQK